MSLSGQLPLSRRSRARVPLPLEHLNERSALFAPRRKGRKKKTPDVATAAVCFPSLRRLCCCRYCCRCWCWCCFRPPVRSFVRPSVSPAGRLRSVSSVSVNHGSVSPFLLLFLSELLGGGEQLSHRLPCVAVSAARLRTFLRVAPPGGRSFVGG